MIDDIQKWPANPQRAFGASGKNPRTEWKTLGNRQFLSYGDIPHNPYRTADTQHPHEYNVGRQSAAEVRQVNSFRNELTQKQGHCPLDDQNS
jgi:hypothetical protein